MNDLQEYINSYNDILNNLNSGSLQLQVMTKTIIPKVIDDNINSIHITYYNERGLPSESHILHLPLIENMSELMQDMLIRNTIEKLINRKLNYK